MLASFTPREATVVTLARVNLRRHKPSTSANIAGTLERDLTIPVYGVGPGDSVSGNNIWYATSYDTYIWSGACAAQSAPAAEGTAFSVPRRPDGTIRPLTNTQLKSVYGSFSFKPGSKKGAVVIDPPWVTDNIVTIDSPVLAEEGYPKLKVHTKAAESFTAVLADIDRLGLSEHILTCAGSFVSRHKGWDPARDLSSHSWGVAIDVNVAWNGYGRTPAPLGATGSVRELVPIFEHHGFAWGGYFSSPHEDGMHFELARLDL